MTHAVLPPHVLVDAGIPCSVSGTIPGHDAVSGSAVPRIVLKDFKKLKLCIPPMNSISTYRELLKSIEKLLLQKTEENQRLAALRDTLLPKLMSGEIKL